ncbi:hypothetical protein IFM89_006168 [Coptis chinensis]|uniref:Uncharacterized protein n=1 Tax=Coptis chinensis TaxID=261450 RepID=A0A835GVV2_9MAGN|nr:hypothetical protein IFM89_006168 [Coptis chinensis]
MNNGRQVTALLFTKSKMLVHNISS